MAQQLLRPRGFAARSLAYRSPRHTRFLSDFAPASSGTRSDSYDVASSTLAPSLLSRYLLGQNLSSQWTSETPYPEDVELLLKCQTAESINARQLRRPNGSRLKPRPPAGLHAVSNLRDLQSWFEKYAVSGFVGPIDQMSLRKALNNCERHHSSQEVLSTLNAFVRRCHRSGVSVPDAVHIEGLRCASQIFLPSALLYHVTNLSQPVRGADAHAIISLLCNTLRLLRYNDSTYDTDLILAVVAGEGPQGQMFPVALLDKLLLDDESYAAAIELLQLVGGARKRLGGILGSLVDRLSQNPSSGLVINTYKCLSTLLEIGEVGPAEACLEPLSRIMKTISNVHVPLSVSSQLLASLDKHSLSKNLDLESLIPATEDPLYDDDDDAGIQMDGEHIDYSSVENLVRQIQKHGGSLSTSELSIAIDALGECEGLSIPLFHEDGMKEFAWLPKWIPVARQSEGSSDSSSALGLLQARVSFSHDTLATTERSRNLFQLGYLVRRSLLPAGLLDSAEEANSGNWELTGYLVVFDRISSEFLLMFVGDDSTVFGSDNPSPSDRSVTESLQQHPLIGSLSRLNMPTCEEDLHRDIKHVALPVENAGSRYVFDIDPKVLTY